MSTTVIYAQGERHTWRETRFRARHLGGVHRLSGHRRGPGHRPRDGGSGNRRPKGACTCNTEKKSRTIRRTRTTSTTSTRQGSGQRGSPRWQPPGSAPGAWLVPGGRSRPPRFTTAGHRSGSRPPRSGSSIIYYDLFPSPLDVPFWKAKVLISLEASRAPNGPQRTPGSLQSRPTSAGFVSVGKNRIGWWPKTPSQRLLGPKRHQQVTSHRGRGWEVTFGEAKGPMFGHLLGPKRHQTVTSQFWYLSFDICELTLLFTITHGLGIPPSGRWCGVMLIPATPERPFHSAPPVDDDVGPDRGFIIEREPETV
ncbi:hypothetical protein N9L68_06465 [bacterium]|nr:hypothetical protein [bacterium]